MINKGASSFTFAVNKNGINTNSFNITVYPLTMSAYEKQFPHLPCGTVGSILSGGDPAEGMSYV